MAIAAFVVSAVAVLISLGSLVYVRRADQRARRADRVGSLERLGTIMRNVAATAAATASDPLAVRRLHAARARLEEAIAAADVELPACSEYASHNDSALLPAAERELEQAIAVAGKD